MLESVKDQVRFSRGTEGMKDQFLYRISQAELDPDNLVGEPFMIFTYTWFSTQQYNNIDIYS